jgi:hypothetical protein
MDRLKKDEEDVLDYIYEEKYTNDYKPFKISDIISKYIGKYNNKEIIDVIYSFVSQGFIVFKIKKSTQPELVGILDRLKANPELLELVEASLDMELCVPGVDKIDEIKKILRYRRGKNWLKKNTVLTWQFLWKHFIVAIIVTLIVSVVTTYILTKYITHP